MNPPYGREIGRWMKKAYESSLDGATVVCLVPARTDTCWWHDYAFKGEVRFIRGRLKFGGSKNAAPFPSAVVVFRPTFGIELNPEYVESSKTLPQECGLDCATSAVAMEGAA
jgi:site-specific DNA-methyltransferase (adenine-specific)